MTQQVEDIRADLEKAVWDAYYLVDCLSRISARLLREEVKAHMGASHEQ